jgi:hypothetical protein
MVPVNGEYRIGDIEIRVLEVYAANAVRDKFLPSQKDKGYLWKLIFWSETIRNCTGESPKEYFRIRSIAAEVEQAGNQHRARTFV